jgi:hypothetical protein
MDNNDIIVRADDAMMRGSVEKHSIAISGEREEKTLSPNYLKETGVPCYLTRLIPAWVPTYCLRKTALELECPAH